MRTQTDKVNKISTDAVQKATGKTWSQWLKVLDAAGCKIKTHKQIVEIVSKKFKLGPWWQQMVTVGYEQARGLRVKHQNAGGFGVNVNKTLAVDAGAIFAAWTEPKISKKWIDADSFEISTATARKSVRMKWNKDNTRVSVMLYPKGAEKTQLSIEHSKLSSAAAVEKMRKFWKQKVEKLEKLLDV